MLLWTWVYNYLFRSLLFLLLGIYPEVELLDHIVCLLFWGITIPFSQRAAPVLLIHSHWQCTKVLLSLHPYQCLFLSAFSFLNNTHPNECEAVSHGFDFCELSISFSCLLSWCFFCLFGDFFFFGCFVTCLRILYALGILVSHLWCMVQVFSILSLFDSCLLTCFPGGSAVKKLSAVQGTQVLSLGWEDPLEKGMATHSSIVAWEIPWTEEPGQLQSMWSQRVGYCWVTNTHFWLCLCFFFSHWMFLFLYNQITSIFLYCF